MAEHPDIQSRYPLQDAQIHAYRRDGFIKLKGVFSLAVLDHYGAEITRQVKALNTQTLPLDQRDTYGRAFLQVKNLWRQSDVARELVLSPRLGRIAAGLMGVRGVRLYHDQALYKEPSGGHTPWHADQYYWPLASDRCCTAWVPLQATPLEMGPLSFAVGSHHSPVGRDLEISDESEAKLQAAVEAAGFPYECSAYDAGEVSFHSGWTFHRAGPNATRRPRRVMTVIFMDVDMRLAEPQYEWHVAGRDAYCPGIEVGEVIDSPMNPVIWAGD